MTTVQFFSVAPEHDWKSCWLAAPAVSVGTYWQDCCCPRHCGLRLKMALPPKLALTTLLQETDSVLMYKMLPLPPFCCSAARPFHCSPSCKLPDINVWRPGSGSAPASFQWPPFFVWITHWDTVKLTRFQQQKGGRGRNKQKKKTNTTHKTNQTKPPTPSRQTKTSTKPTNQHQPHNPKQPLKQVFSLVLISTQGTIQKRNGWANNTVSCNNCIFTEVKNCWQRKQFQFARPVLWRNSCEYAINLFEKIIKHTTNE